MKILIVENDVILSSVWASRFGQEHEVYTAKNVTEAIKRLQDEHYMPELVMLDLRLNGPNASGLVVYQMIRDLCGPNVTVLMITGLEDTVPLYQQAYQVSQEDPQVSLLDKPVDMAVLRGYLKQTA